MTDEFCVCLGVGVGWGGSQGTFRVNKSRSQEELGIFIKGGAKWVFCNTVARGDVRE